MKLKILVAAAVAMLAGCGGSAGEDAAAPAATDASTLAPAVENDSAQSWMRAADVQPRIAHLIQAEAALFNLDPAALAGVHVDVVDDTDVGCPGVHSAGGCTIGKAVKVSTFGAHCVEQVPIAHELLHVWIGDPHHKDPRWHELPALMLGEGC